MIRTSSALAVVCLLIGCGDDSADIGRLRDPSMASPRRPSSDGKGSVTNEETPPAGVPANATAKQVFTMSVHPELSKACGGCHSGGTAPVWMSTNADAAYELMFQRGYVGRSSSLLSKGAHASGGGPALTTAQSQALSQWIELELKERGDKAPPSVLEKVARCLDNTKFKAIKFETLMTVTRTKTNNPNGFVENPETCTGCAPRQCSSCHSHDPGSGFIMAVGNDIFGPDHTFAESKQMTPPYLQKYVGLSPEGVPVPSNGIKNKSLASVEDSPSGHPMYFMTRKMEEAIDAFVNDAITKVKAGQCEQ